MSFESKQVTAGSAKGQFFRILSIVVTAPFLSCVASAAVSPPPASLQTLKLGWNPNPEVGIQGYKILMGSQSGTYSQSLSTGNNETFAVQGLTSGQTYYFAVVAIGSTGLESLPSNELAVTIATPVPAPTPGMLTLGWNANPESGLQGYRVSVGTQSGQYTEFHDTGTALRFPIGNLQVGQTYYFVVTAIGGTGLESLPSNELMVTIGRPPLPTGGMLASNGSGSLSLNWAFPVSDLGSSPEFIVQVSSNLKDWSPVATVAATDSVGRTGQMEQFSWTLPSAVAGGQMFYRLTARNWMGESATL